MRFSRLLLIFIVALTTWGVRIDPMSGPTMSAYAEEAPQVVQSIVTPPDAPSMAASASRMVGGLLFCLGVLAVGVHLYKRYSGALTPSNKKRLVLIDRLPLNQKVSLCIVRIDNAEIVIAAGPEGAQRIHTVNIVRTEEFAESIADLYSIREEGKAWAG